VVRVVRPFVIGEKVLEITVGDEKLPALAEHQSLKSEPTYDIMDLVSGRTLGPYLQTIGKMMDNLKFVAEALLDPERSRAMVQMFDEIRPMMKHLGIMSKEASGLLQALNKQQKLVRSVDNLVAITDEVTKMLPMISKDAPQLAADLAKISHNMAILTDEVNKTLPMMQAMAPEVPRVSKRAMEALDETVVTLKALQRSFVLKGNVQDVRDEEKTRNERQPASQNSEKSLETK
jgi:phospholipid/cholesterol/gamma-HCH transport system substrate-binding protein